jgi:Tfp pilus assembly protein PilF
MKERKVDQVVAAPHTVDSLLNKAAKQRRSGNLTAAVATIERAIRIAPRYPGSYYMLADIRLEQGSNSQARSLAGKALALGAQGELKQQAEDLIATCDRL